MKKIFSLVILLSIFVVVQSQEKVIPYTQADRDRMVRVETKIESMEKRMDDMIHNTNSRFDDVNSRIDNLSARIDRMEDHFNSYFMWGFGMVIMSILGLVGFIIYNRRTTLAPVDKKTDKVIKVLEEQAKTNPTLREILNKAAI